MRIHFPYVLRVTLVLLTFSLSLTAHGTAPASSRFYTPQKQSDAPEWLRVFEQQGQPGSQGQKFKAASARTVATSQTQYQRGTESLPPLGFRNRLVDKRTIVAQPSFAPTQSVAPAPSMSMRMIELSRNATRIGGTSSFTPAYSSTVYEPFDANAPSDYAEGIGSTVGQMTGPRKSFPERPDTPPANTSPIGEPWILLFFGLLFAAGVAIRIGSGLGSHRDRIGGKSGFCNNA